METELFRDRMWKYLEENHPDARIAWKGYGKSLWRYATVATFAILRFEKNQYNHRAVLPEELVADYDCTGNALAENATQLICRLEEEGVNFTVWRTNGKESGGVHIHALYDIPENVGEPKLLKQLLLEHYVGDLKSLGLDSQVLGNHLIRFEGGAYDKVPPYQASKKTLIYQNGDPFIRNTVPRVVWDKYAKEVLPFVLRDLRKRCTIIGKKDMPKSIQFLLSPKFKDYHDGGKRAIFALASYYRKLPDDQLLRLLKDFNRYNLKTPLLDEQILATIRSVRKETKYPVGEKYRKELILSIGARKEVYDEKE